MTDDLSIRAGFERLLGEFPRVQVFVSSGPGVVLGRAVELRIEAERTAR